MRVAAGRTVTTEHREFATTTAGLLKLAVELRARVFPTIRTPDIPSASASGDCFGAPGGI